MSLSVHLSPLLAPPSCPTTQSSWELTVLLMVSTILCIPTSVSLITYTGRALSEAQY